MFSISNVISHGDQRFILEYHSDCLTYQMDQMDDHGCDLVPVHENLDPTFHSIIQHEHVVHILYDRLNHVPHLQHLVHPRIRRMRNCFGFLVSVEKSFIRTENIDESIWVGIIHLPRRISCNPYIP